VQDYGFRIYKPELGKFLSVDPLTQSYPWYTPYQFAGNKPIAFIDLDGAEEMLPIIQQGGARQPPIMPKVSNPNLSQEELNALQQTQNVFGTTPYFYEGENGKTKWIDYWRRDQSLQNAIRSASHLYNVEPAELFVIAMGEGFQFWLNNPDRNNYEVEGFGNLGIDTFSDDYGDMLTRGITHFMGISFYDSGPIERNEPGDNGIPVTVHSGVFPNIYEGMKGIAAFWIKQKADFHEYV
jgi:hypothetical protein